VAGSRGGGNAFVLNQRQKDLQLPETDLHRVLLMIITIIIDFT
jgi:hypothetical protein